MARFCSYKVNTFNEHLIYALIDVARFTVESHLATNVMKMMIYSVPMAYEGMLMTGFHRITVKTCYPQAWCKFFQQVVTRLTLTALIQLDENEKFVGILSTSCNNPTKY